jgi:hypothetical protein
MLIVNIDVCSVAAEEKIMSFVWHAKIISDRISSPSPYNFVWYATEIPPTYTTEENT